MEPLELPTDRARPAERSGAAPPSIRGPGRGGRRVAGTLGRSRQTSLFMVLLAAFQVLLSRYSGQTDIAVGTPIAGRDRAEVEGLIGFFVNTLVLRADLSGDPSFEDLLAQVRDSVTGGVRPSGCCRSSSWSRSSRRTGIWRGNPLFQAMFVLQNAPSVAWALPGWRSSRAEGSQAGRSST